MTPAQIDSLWTLLAQTWGAKFLDQYGVKPNDAWAMTLANLGPQAGRHALTELIREGSAFPPTLPEFIAYARKWRPAPSGEEISAQLPPPRPDNETLKRKIQMLRDQLNSPEVFKPMYPR